MKALIISLESFQKGTVPEEVKKYIQKCGGYPFIILDESSKIKTNEPCKDSKKSKRTQAVLSLNKTGERCILTGTFMSKTPVNAYDQMNFLEDGFFSESMYAFAEHYTIRRNLPSVRGARITITQKDYETIRKKLLRCGKDVKLLSSAMDSIHSFYGVSREDCVFILKHPEYTPFKNIDNLWSRIGRKCFKIERSDIYDVPPKVYKTYNVPLTPEQKKLYLQLQNMNCTDKIVVDNGLQLYLRFQDICNGYEPVEGEQYFDKEGNEHHHVDLTPLKVNPKLDLLEEVVDDIGTEQIVIWCSRTKLMYDAYSRLTSAGYTAGIYDGKVGKEERKKDYEDFAEGKIQILFMNQASGAYGLDKLKNADYAIYLCNDYSVEHREQSEYRTDRGEVTVTKYVIDITCKGTCEDRVTEALKQGKELLSTGKTDTSLFLLEEEKDV